MEQKPNQTKQIGMRRNEFNSIVLKFMYAGVILNEELDFKSF